MTHTTDPRTDAAIDTALLDELLHNERIIQHPTFGPVRLRRPTPRQEKFIADARRKQYHQDLLDSAVLSRAEIEKVAQKRGMWTPELTERLEILVGKTGQAMAFLDAIGFKDLETIVAEYEIQAKVLREALADNETLLPIVERYLDLNQEPLPDDYDTVIEQAFNTLVDDAMEAAKRLRQQIQMLKDMLTVRKELETLQRRQADLFIDSIESRANRAEELARLYYCTTTTDGKPLWPTFDAIYDATPEDCEVLTMELFYFFNGIKEEFKATLQKYGFLARQAGTSASSADSRGLPTSNSDGDSPESGPVPSSEPTA